MKLKAFYFISLILIVLSCDDSDEAGSNERSLSVSSFNSVQVGGNTVLRFDNSLESSETVVIKGNPTQVGSVKLNVSDGTLYIRSGEGVELSDSLTIIANPDILTGITLEADQRAVVYWDGDHNVCLSNLDIKTEANSILGLFNICANTINIQQEAKSKVNLKNWFLQAEDSVTFLKGDVDLIGVHTYLIANNKVIIAENVVEIEEDGSTYIVFEGSSIKTFTIIPTVNAKLEATSELQADELPIRNLDIKLEGESHASVWVTHHLSGKGEGKSSLNYDGSPVIDYITQGEARIQND